MKHWLRFRFGSCTYWHWIAHELYFSFFKHWLRFRFGSWILWHWIAHKLYFAFFISHTWCRGLPTIDGKTARGASSPANPALHIPDPLSKTIAAISSSAIFRFFSFRIQNWTKKFPLRSNWARFVLVLSNELRTNFIFLYISIYCHRCCSC